MRRLVDDDVRIASDAGEAHGLKEKKPAFAAMAVGGTDVTEVSATDSRPSGADEAEVSRPWTEGDANATDRPARNES